MKSENNQLRTLNSVKIVFLTFKHKYDSSFIVYIFYYPVVFQANPKLDILSYISFNICIFIYIVNRCKYSAIFLTYTLCLLPRGFRRTNKFITTCTSWCIFLFGTTASWRGIIVRSVWNWKIKCKVWVICTNSMQMDKLKQRWRLQYRKFRNLAKSVKMNDFMWRYPIVKQRLIWQLSKHFQSPVFSS